MPREAPNYRDKLQTQIEHIQNAFPNHEFLNKKEVMAFTGWGHAKVTQYFPFTGNAISVVQFASLLIK